MVRWKGNCGIIMLLPVSRIPLCSIICRNKIKTLRTMLLNYPEICRSIVIEYRRLAIRFSTTPMVDSPFFTMLWSILNAKTDLNAILKSKGNISNSAVSFKWIWVRVYPFLKYIIGSLQYAFLQKRGTKRHW